MRQLNSHIRSHADGGSTCVRQQERKNPTRLQKTQSLTSGWVGFEFLQLIHQIVPEKVVTRLCESLAQLCKSILKTHKILQSSLKR